MQKPTKKNVVKLELFTMKMKQGKEVVGIVAMMLACDTAKHLNKMAKNKLVTLSFAKVKK